MALASATAENAALDGLSGNGSTNVIPDVSLHTASFGVGTEHAQCLITLDFGDPT